MSPKRIALGIVPVVALLAASAASGETLSAFLRGDSTVPSGAVGQDCANDTTDTNPAMFAYAQTSDSCGNVTSAKSYTSGTTQKGTTVNTECSVPTSHFAALVDDPVPTTGHVSVYCTAQKTDPTTCWNTNVNTGQCLSSCSAVVNSRFSTTSGNSACTNRTWTAYSIGGP